MQASASLGDFITTLIEMLELWSAYENRDQLQRGLLLLRGDEPEQTLIGVGTHSHGIIVPNKIPEWYIRYIEDALRERHLTPRDIQLGRGLKQNILGRCPALVNRDKVGALLRKLRKSNGIVRRSSNPMDINHVIAPILKRNEEELDEGKLGCMQ